jgi:hypothetical protein
MKRSATGIATVLLIAATTSLAMAQGHHRRYYDNYRGGSGVQGQPYNVSPNYYDYYDGSSYGAGSRQLNVSPASPNASIEQER